jgi:hypothetical protein
VPYLVLLLIVQAAEVSERRPLACTQKRNSARSNRLTPLQMQKVN